MLRRVIWGPTCSHLKYFRKGPRLVCLDVGAWNGEIVKMLLEKIGSDGKIIAVEPDPRGFATLKNRFENRSNVILLDKACWNKKERISFCILSGMHSRVSSKPTKERTIEVIEVEADTLDNILEDLGMEYADYVKIDTEGSEVEVLEGFSKYKRGAVFHVEFHNNKDQILELLKKKQLLVIEIEEWQYAIPKGWRLGVIHATAERG